MTNDTRPVRALLRSLLSLLTLACTLGGSTVQAQAPQLFNLTYDARYGSWGAESVRSLTQEEANGIYHQQAQSKILLLGRSVSTITEDAHFRWEDSRLVPIDYQFRQTGIGARTRSVEFDHTAGVARFQVKEKRGEVALNGPVYDELTALLILREHLQRGETEIRFDVMDRDAIEMHHYRVLDSGILHTALGDFSSMHVARIREEGNQRKTEFWLARDHDFVVLKLLQSEPDGSDIELDITGGEVNGVALQGLQESHLGELEADDASQG